MNRVVIFASEYEKKLPALREIEINDSLRVNHIRTILKLIVGDIIKVTLENLGLAQAKITNLSEKNVCLDIIDQIPGKKARYQLIIGLSRPQTCKKIIEHATSMGVGSFDFFSAELGEKSYANAKLFSHKEYEELLHLGLSQSSGLYKTPIVRVHQRINKEAFSQMEQKFILSPFAEENFTDVEIDFKKPITLAIGPERGFTTKEVEIFKEMGYKEIRISNSILRVEIATFATLGQLDLLDLKQSKEL